MSFREQVKSGNEIWQDQTGCLYVPDFTGQGWYSFATTDVIYEDNPLVDLPLTPVVDGNGNLVVTRLNYPNGE